MGEKLTREQVDNLIRDFERQLQQEGVNRGLLTKALYSARMYRGDYAEGAKDEFRRAFTTGSLRALCRSIVYGMSASAAISITWFVAYFLLFLVGLILPTATMGWITLGLAVVYAIVFLMTQDLILVGNVWNRVGIVAMLTISGLLNMRGAP